MPDAEDTKSHLIIWSYITKNAFCLIIWRYIIERENVFKKINEITEVLRYSQYLES